MPAWLLWTLVALLSWGVWAVLSKLLGDTFTGGQSQALSTLGLLPILAWLAWAARGTWRSASGRGLALAGLGGIVTCLGNVAYYDAISRGGKVASIVSLTALYPLVTILLAVLVLRERLNRIQKLGLIPSLVAIWLFNVPDGSGLLSPTVVFAALPIVLWGLSGFLQKLATNHVAATPAALAYLGAFVPVGLAYLLIEPPPPNLTPTHWALVLALGFFLAFGNLSVLVAFSRGGKAAVIAPLGSLYPVVSVPIAVVLLHESVGPREWIGILCALTSVAALSWESSPTPGQPHTPLPKRPNTPAPVPSPSPSTSSSSSTTSPS